MHTVNASFVGAFILKIFIPLFIMCVARTILLLMQFTCPQEDSSLGQDPFVVDNDAIAYAYSVLRDDESLLECSLHHPYFGEDLVFPLDYNVIFYAPSGCSIATAKSNTTISLSSYQLWWITVDLLCKDFWRSYGNSKYLIKSDDHEMVSYDVITRWNDTTPQDYFNSFYHPQLQLQMAEIVGKCNTCQREY